jgi:hypothetical protein
MTAMTPLRLEVSTLGVKSLRCKLMHQRADDGLPEPEGPPRSSGANATEQDPLLTQAKQTIHQELGDAQANPEGEAPSASSKAVGAKDYKA